MAHDDETLTPEAPETDSHSSHSSGEEGLWQGGVSPVKASYGKVMMWYFLVSDAFSFSGLLISYGALRFSNAVWPDPEIVFSDFPFGIHDAPLMFVSLMTFILILSSVTMVRAVQDGTQMNKKGVVKWLVFTIIGGAAFLGCQAWEWTHMITNHVDPETGLGGPITIYQNPFGGPGGTLGVAGSGAISFGQLFFTITGFHGFHVFSGVVFNIIILFMTLSGVFERRGHYEMVEKVGLYWHFVDLVWVFVFLFFYLL